MSVFSVIKEADYLLYKYIRDDTFTKLPTSNCYLLQSTINKNWNFHEIYVVILICLNCKKYI